MNDHADSGHSSAMHAPHPRRAPAIRLFIDGLELRGHHGVFAEERSRGSCFQIHVELDGDLARGAQTDALSDTVDLAAIAQTIRTINEHRQYNLIESLADAIALSILQDFPRVDGVTVRVRKLQPHGVEDAEASGVEVKRWRT